MYLCFWDSFHIILPWKWKISLQASMNKCHLPQGRTLWPHRTDDEGRHGAETLTFAWDIHVALDGFLLPIFARNGPGSPAEECAEIDAEDSFEGCWIYTARVCSLLKRSKAACRWFLPRSFPGTIRVTNLETSPNWLCFRTIATFLSSKRDACVQEFPQANMFWPSDGCRVDFSNLPNSPHGSSIHPPRHDVREWWASRQCSITARGCWSWFSLQSCYLASKFPLISTCSIL